MYKTNSVPANKNEVLKGIRRTNKKYKKAMTCMSSSDVSTISSKEALKDVEVIPWKITQCDNIDQCKNDEKLQELLSELQDKIYQATVIAEKNIKRNSLGQVVIPIGDEWRDECCWDEYSIYDMPSPTLYGEEARKVYEEIRTPPSEIAKKNGEKLMKYFEDNFPKVSTMCVPMTSIPIIKGEDAEEILNSRNIITRGRLDKWAEENKHIEIKKGY